MGDGGSICFTRITRDGRWFKKTKVKDGKTPSVPPLFAINPQYHHKRVV